MASKWTQQKLSVHFNKVQQKSLNITSCNINWAHKSAFSIFNQSVSPANHIHKYLYNNQFWLLSNLVGLLIGCFQCQSYNGDNPRCEDPFNSTYLYDDDMGTNDTFDDIYQVTISPTFYERLFCTKVLRKAFL
jgi:hypothetical protein